MLKFFIFSVITLTLLYQLSGTEASTKNEAKKVFHKLMKLVNKAIDEGQKTLNKALNTVKNKATQLENKAKVELDKVLSPLKNKLNDLVAKAKAKGFDVSKCQKYVDDFSTTPDNMLRNLVNCVNQPISKAQGYVNDAFNSLKKIEQDLNHIDKDIGRCKGKIFKKTKCYAKIIERIERETKSAPKHIVEDVSKTSALILKLLPSLDTCFVNQLKKAGEDATKDISQFAICAGL